MLNTVPNTAAQTTTPQMALPDASDNASSLVGYNINNYVFGDLNGTDTYTPNSQNQTVQNLVVYLKAKILKHLKIKLILNQQKQKKKFPKKHQNQLKALLKVPRVKNVLKN